MQHTVESLMALYQHVITCQHDSKLGDSSYEVAAEAALQEALTEVFDALAEAKSQIDVERIGPKAAAEKIASLQSKCESQAREIEHLRECMRGRELNEAAEVLHLRAKIAAMESQEPIGYVFDDGENIYTGSVIRRNQIDEYVPVYLAPGAAPKGKQA